MKKKLISSDELIEDLKSVIAKLKSENPMAELTRNYYRAHGHYSDKDVAKVFSSFVDFKNALYKKDGSTLNIDKKLFSLMEENKELKKDKDNLIKNSINTDNLLSLYQENLDKGIVLKNNKNIKVGSYKKIGKVKKEAILMLSDFHLGETVVGAEIHNINEYNSKIMIERLDRIFHYFVYYCKKYDISIVNILLLGDLLSGCHHEELKKTNEMDDVSAIFFLQEYLVNKFLEIEKEFSEIKIEILVGNHSRIPEGKPEFKKASILNYEYILAKQLKMTFDTLQSNNKSHKIKINVSQSLFNVVTVADRKFLITHGHILSNGSNSFAGIPYYGLAMSASKLDGAFKQFQYLDFSDILCGHLHCTSKVKTPIGNIWINGSIIGVGEFALYKMKVTGLPEQTLLIVEDGQVNAEITLRGN
jgi:hypothetical protein